MQGARGQERCMERGRGGRETEGKRGQERERERERKRERRGAAQWPVVSVGLCGPVGAAARAVAGVGSLQYTVTSACGLYTVSTWSAYSQPTACMRSARGQLVVSLRPAFGHRMVSIRPAYAHTLSEDHQHPAAHSYVSMRPVHGQYMVSIQSA